MTTPETEENDRMRNASGNVKDDDPLVCFLYYLARDHLANGIIEEVLNISTFYNVIGAYTNGWLARWAQDARNRLDEARKRHDGIQTISRMGTQIGFCPSCGKPLNNLFPGCGLLDGKEMCLPCIEAAGRKPQAIAK